MMVQLNSNHKATVVILDKGYERYLKIPLIFGFLLATYNIFILLFIQPPGYVVDIYSALPFSFYVAAILCYLISASVLLLNSSKLRASCILLLTLNHLVILSIPYMLGYYSMGRADDMSYIGEYLHISKTGFISSSWDIYPAAHIIGAFLSTISGLTANKVSFVIPPVFSFMFIAGLCLCCWFFLKKPMLVNIAVIVSFIFYLGRYNFLNTPNALFFAYMSLYTFILFRYIKNPVTENSIILLIPTLLVPFTHPFIVFFVTFLLVSLLLLGNMLNRFVTGCYQRSYWPLLLLIVTFLSWFIYCEVLLESFGRAYHAYLLRITEPVLIETTDKLIKINPDTIKITKLLFTYYGRYIIPFIIISIVTSIIYLKRDYLFYRLKNYYMFFSILYLLFLTIMIILLLNPIISHTPDRITNLNFVVYAQVPLFAISLYIIYEKLDIFENIIILLVILSGTWCLSLFGTLDSPNIFLPNLALTYNEVSGMEWFYDVRGTENLIVPISQIVRFHHLFDDNGSDKYIPISDHFGYQSTSESFAEIALKHDQESYVILLTFDELLYQKVPGFSEVGRYTADDFARFRADPSINVKIYDGKDIEIYYIQQLEYISTTTPPATPPTPQPP